ncbi:hypothetical protein C0Q70_00298 [Pomacea canaliculata]|uniref:Uncharacterized protein n=1 Tax=Pomacea canaliculata TaxID=400727 RepID=A0A2T7PWC6_POMCA|nr:hypothetical protein C0Q70_00298 [Pomacea canaliculata]
MVLVVDVSTANGSYPARNRVQPPGQPPIVFPAHKSSMTEWKVIETQEETVDYLLKCLAVNVYQDSSLRAL